VYSGITQIRPVILVSALLSLFFGRFRYEIRLKCCSGAASHMLLQRNEKLLHRAWYCGDKFAHGLACFQPYKIVLVLAYAVRKQEAKLSQRWPTVLPKIVRVTWPRPRLLSGKLSMRLLGITHTKPCIKFEVSSSSSFKDMFDRMPKIVKVTWPGPRPLSG